MSEKDNVIQMPTNNPPPVAGETFPNPNIVGALTQPEMEGFANLRKVGNNLLIRIGSLEALKARVLGELGVNEEQIELLLQGVSKRLGIPDGQKYQILPDGKIMAAGAIPPMEAPPAQ